MLSNDFLALLHVAKEANTRLSNKKNTIILTTTKKKLSVNLPGLFIITGNAINRAAVRFAHRLVLYFDTVNY